MCNLFKNCQSASRFWWFLMKALDISWRLVWHQGLSLINLGTVDLYVALSPIDLIIADLHLYHTEPCNHQTSVEYQKPGQKNWLGGSVEVPNISPPLIGLFSSVSSHVTILFLSGDFIILFPMKLLFQKRHPDFYLLGLCIGHGTE